MAQITDRTGGLMVEAVNRLAIAAERIANMMEDDRKKAKDDKAKCTENIDTMLNMAVTVLTQIKTARNLKKMVAGPASETRVPPPDSAPKPVDIKAEAPKNSSPPKVEAVPTSAPAPAPAPTAGAWAVDHKDVSAALQMLQRFLGPALVGSAPAAGAEDRKDIPDAAIMAVIREGVRRFSSGSNGEWFKKNEQLIEQLILPLFKGQIIGASSVSMDFTQQVQRFFEAIAGSATAAATAASSAGAAAAATSTL